MLRAWRVYSQLAERYPYRIQAIQTSMLMATGDLVAQTVVEQRRLGQVEPVRLARFALLGLVAVGPGLRLWYGILDHVVKNPSAKRAAILKMSLDQGVFAPTFLLGFLALMGALQQQSWPQIKTKIASQYWDIMIANYKVWPAVQICNFWLVPLRHRVLVAQLVALFWNTYLSWKANRDDDLQVLPESPASGNDS